MCSYTAVYDLVLQLVQVGPVVLVGTLPPGVVRVSSSRCSWGLWLSLSLQVLAEPAGGVVAGETAEDGWQERILLPSCSVYRLL